MCFCLPSSLVCVDIVLLLPSMTLQSLHAAEQAYIVNSVKAQLGAWVHIFCFLGAPLPLSSAAQLDE